MAQVKQQDPQARAADNLISVFEHQILNGTLQDGDPLPTEREIVQTYGVSRTVVREAVLALSNKGLVDARPRFRPVVRKPGYDAAIQAVGSVAMRLLTEPGGVRNLFDFRIMMEAGLARQAAIHANRDHIANLKTALEANEAAIHNSHRFFDTDIAFHAVLYDVPDNPVLPSIHKAYTDWLSHHWTQMPRQPERNVQNAKAHRAIFEAILLRDPDAAEAALRTHLDAAWTQVRETFNDL